MSKLRKMPDEPGSMIRHLSPVVQTIHNASHVFVPLNSHQLTTIQLILIYSCS